MKIDKATLLDKIRKAIEDSIYCGDVCYNYNRGEYCNVEGVDMAMRDIERILDEQE